MGGFTSRMRVCDENDTSPFDNLWSGLVSSLASMESEAMADLEDVQKLIGHDEEAHDVDLKAMMQHLFENKEGIKSGDYVSMCDICKRLRNWSRHSKVFQLSPQYDNVHKCHVMAFYSFMEAVRKIKDLDNDMCLLLDDFVHEKPLMLSLYVDESVRVSIQKRVAPLDGSTPKNILDYLCNVEPTRFEKFKIAREHYEKLALVKLGAIMHGSGTFFNEMTSFVSSISYIMETHCSH